MPKVIIRRKINLLRLPIEILSIIVLRLRYCEVRSLRLTCHLLRIIVNAYTKELIPQGYNVILSAKSILQLAKVEVISLDYAIIVSNNNEFLAISQHPTLHRFVLDLKSLDGDFYMNIFFFVKMFMTRKDYDISFVYKDKEAIRISGKGLILTNTKVSDTLNKLLSIFTSTIYRGRYVPGIILPSSFTHLEIIEPTEQLNCFEMMLTTNIKSVFFNYSIDSIGSCITIIGCFINDMARKNRVFPNITYFGRINIRDIYQLNIAFPNVEVVELSLYSIMCRTIDIGSIKPILSKYKEIIINTEFYYYESNNSIINIFPKDLHDRITIRRKD